MNAAPISRPRGRDFAVIRNYEPTRIECELLAQVFEVISNGPRHRDDELDQAAVTTIGDTSEVAAEASVQKGSGRIEVAPRRSLERAA